SGELAIMSRGCGLEPLLMLVGLTRTTRMRAGWVVALAYLLCVLTPGLAFAFGGKELIAHCLLNSTASQQQPVGQVHDHGHHQHGSHHADAAQAAAADQPSPSPRPDHASPGACCGTLCISAMPVAVAVVADPPSSVSACVTEPRLSLTDDPPPRHF